MGALGTLCPRRGLGLSALAAVSARSYYPDRVGAHAGRFREGRPYDESQ
jgi:hypothetical protein